MANSSIRLPKATPFELPEVNEDCAPELETALMSDLGFLNSSAAPTPTVPLPAAAPEQPAKDSTTAEAGARATLMPLPPRAYSAPKPRAADPNRMAADGFDRTQAETFGKPPLRPAEQPIDAVTPSAVSGAPLSTSDRWDSLDADAVARRLAQLRGPRMRSEAAVRDTRPVETPRRMSPEPAAAAARTVPARAVAPQARAAERPPTGAVRERGLAPRAATRNRSPVPRPADGTDIRQHDLRDSNALVSPLPDWARDEDLAAERALSRRPRRNMIAVAALLLVGAGVGAIAALHWSSPAQQEAAAAAPPVLFGATPAAAATTPNAAPDRVAATAPTSVISNATTAALAPPQSALPPPKPAAPAVSTPSAAAPPSWLVEDDPATFALGGQHAGAAGKGDPSWYTEDDPGAGTTSASVAPRAAPAAVAVATAASPAAAAASIASTGPQASPVQRRMVISADVDLRAGPDARFGSIGILKAGTAVAVGDCQLWCQVTLNAQSGWVFYSFLSDPALNAPAH